MFDDIIKTIERVNKVEKNCSSCGRKSRILSNYPDKVYCLQWKNHISPQYYCNRWTLEKKIEDEKKA